MPFDALFPLAKRYLQATIQTIKCDKCEHEQYEGILKGGGIKGTEGKFTTEGKPHVFSDWSSDKTSES